MTLPYTTTGLFVNDVILSSFVHDKMQYQIKISLMAYYCYAMEQKISEITNNFQYPTQIRYLIKEIVSIKNSLKRIDRELNKYLFIIIAQNCISCVANITIFYFDRGNKLGSSIAFIMNSLIIMATICYMSDKITKSYLRFLDKFESLELNSLENHQDNKDVLLIERLYAIENELCFTALNLYRIDANFFFSILSFSITFSLIIVQTN